VFNEPLYLEKDYLLLTSDTPVTHELINCLMKWNYTHVYSDGSPQMLHQNSDKADDSQEISNIDISIKVKEKYKEIFSFYFIIISFIDDAYNNFKTNNAIDAEEITAKIKDIINVIKSNRDLILGFAGMQHSVENYMLTHAVNTTIMALAIGDFLKLPPHRLIELGLAAILHEIGMIKLPNSLYLSKKLFSAQERQMMMTHTEIGYRLLKAFKLSENVALGALEHHERMDRTGYPNKLGGEDISLYARIIAVVCSYESQVRKRPYKNEKIAHNSILELLSKDRTKFDENIIKALVFCLSIYPLGSYVLLNNNSKGIVYRTNQGNPKYPIIKLLEDENGEKVSNQVLVQTSKEKNIKVVRTLSWEELDIEIE
jgi:HD-GYP domain-containing protein (c-di-GMP phosphodiesterase class II)